MEGALLDGRKIKKWFRNLDAEPYYIRRLEQEKGITTTVRYDYLIGLDNKTGEIVIPLQDEKGKYVDAIRKGIDEDGDWLEDLGKFHQEVTIQDAMRASAHGKNLRFHGLAVGKDLSIYLIPKKVHISCREKGGKEKCAFCKIGMNARDVVEYTFRPQADREIMVDFVSSTTKQTEMLIRTFFRCPKNCFNVEVDVVERTAVEEISITGDIDYERIDSDYTITTGFVFDQSIKTNANYEFLGTTWSHPRTQQGIHIITKTHSSQDALGKWRYTDEVKEQLRLFQPEDQDDARSIIKKILKYTQDMTANVTQMHKREDVIIATDMVYHSPLRFRFLNRMVSRGWAECLIGGDTRTGKTETVRNMLKHYRAGEFVSSGENVTLSGILGGLQQTHGKKWTLTWGKLPINDRRLVVIDEADELANQGIIGQLSGVRSSGVAELVKIQTQKTLSRTRIIWIANPRHGDLSCYNYGVDVVREVFGKQQDISRLDFAIMCSKNDVPIEEINMRREYDVEHKHTSEACHARVMFAWTRQPHQYRWTVRAEEKILRCATEFGIKYSPEVPLVLGAEMRIKLARLSASLATMMYSVDPEDDGIVVVTEAHVNVVAKWLKSQYSNDAMGYEEFSDQAKVETELRDVPELKGLFNSHDKINQILASEKITVTDIEEIFDRDRDYSRQLLGKFRKCGALKKTSHYHVKNPRFINFLKDQRRLLMDGIDPSEEVF